MTALPINPLIIKSIRERLRLKNALSWGVVIVVVTAFIYGICHQATTNYLGSRDEMAAKFALTAILMMQAVILMLAGTGSVAIGIAQEKLQGVLDYQRMTPMGAVSKILGYLFGLPAREYFLFSLTIPFVIYAAIQADVKWSNLANLYVVGFVTVLLYHMTGMVAGMLSPKPWRAGVATQAMILLTYIFLPVLSRIGFTFFVYLTPRPVFLRLAYEELDWDFVPIAGFQDWQEDVHFFNYDIHPVAFSLVLQGSLMVSLFYIVYRKWKEQTQHPFSKAYALGFFAVTQFLLVGSLWPWLTQTWRYDEVASNMKRSSILQMHAGDVGQVVLGELLYVFFAVSTGMILLLTNMITPTRHQFAGGLRRMKKLELPRVPWLSDAASALPYTIAFIGMTLISYVVLLRLAITHGRFFRIDPATGDLVLLGVLFTTLILYVQAIRQRFGLRGFLMAGFFIWIVPFLSYAFLMARKENALTANYVATPMPVNAFYYAIVNLFHPSASWQDPEAIIPNAGRLARICTTINIVLASVFLALLFQFQRKIRATETAR